MRFERLDLLRYGALTDRTLAFRPGARLHVVYGPNEAGKSSALSAISDLLFGFPERVGYSFRHDPTALRIGARLAARDGHALEFRRRRGRKSTLLTAAETEETLAEDSLAPFLGTLSRDVFQRAFGLDSRALRAGGDTMLKSGGEIGSLLFSAASGLTGLSDLRKSLDAEADTIYAPRKSKDRLFYQVLDQHEDARRAERDSELRSGDWKKLVAEQTDIEAELGAVQTARETTRRGLDRLQRLLRVEPILREIDRDQALLVRYQALATLPDGLAGEIAAALQQAERNAEALQAAAAEKLRLAEDMAAIRVDRAILEAAPQILAIHAQTGAFLKAREDMGRVGAEVDDFDARLNQAAARLGLDSLEALLRAQPTDADLALLRSLVDQGQGLDRELKQSRQRIDEEADALRRLTADMPDARLIDPKPWLERLAAIRPDITELAGLEAADVRLTRAKADLDRAAARLDPPVGDVERLLSVSLPDVTTLANHRRLIDTARAELEQQIQARALLHEEAASVDAALAGLETQGQIVSRPMIADARNARDALVERLAAAPAPETAGLVRAAIADADRLADLALADAERVSRHAQLCLQQRDLQRRLSAADSQVREAEIAAADRLTEFEDLFQAAPVVPVAPDRMIEWRRGVDNLIQLSQAVADAADMLDVLKLKQESVRPALEALSEAIGASAGMLPLSGLARETERRLEELSARWGEYRTLDRLRLAAQATLDRLDERDGDVRRQVAAWRELFNSASAKLGLPEDATIEMAVAALDVWRTIPTLLSERENRIRRVRGMARDMEGFDQAVRGLVADCASDLSGLPSDAAAGLLNDRLATARSAESRHMSLRTSQERVEAKAEVLVAESRSLAERLGGYAATAGLGPEGLGGLVDDLRDRSQLLSQLSNARVRLFEQADGADVVLRRAALGAFDRISAVVEIERLQGEDDRQVERLKTLGIAQADNQRRRLELETGSGAERAVFHKLAAEEEARQLARQWVVLKLAASLLSESMEAYRERQADPVMKRAGQIFAELTGGRFSRLVQLYDEQDELKLAAERAGGEQVPLSGLSEGTGDQLYLALRLAFLDDYCRRNEPAPLILDDIFQTFDDERTAAGLRTLANHGDSYQSILFTHQMSLVDIARSELGTGLDLVRLDG